MSLKLKSLFTKSARNDEEKIAKWRNVADFTSSDDQKQSRFWNSIIYNLIMQNRILRIYVKKEQHLRVRARACARVYHLALACVTKQKLPFESY